jgi:hypothetical protein
MMTWTQITSVDDTAGLNTYQQILESEAVYLGYSSVAGLVKMLQDDCELWFYEDGEHRQALGLRFQPDVEGTFSAKVVNGVVVGPNTTTAEFCRTLFTQLREILDRRNVRSYHARLRSVYLGDGMIRFSAALGVYDHEYQDSQEVGSNQYLRFERKPENKQHDAKFEGPRYHLRAEVG